MITAEAIKTLAGRHGFEAADAFNLPPDWKAAERLNVFLAEGFHGEMAWMAETQTRRSHPQNMWSEAKSALIVGQNYAPSENPLNQVSKTDLANISVYARGDDYHDVIKKSLKALGGDIARQWGGGLKVFVDTAPLMEKPLAQLAGLGWQGKHTNLVSREFGSWLFLGVILLDQSLDQEPPQAEDESHCGTCRACLDICPTNAFVAPYRLDARLCLSYLTIEYKGAWPEDLRSKMGNRIYGCDDCLAVCPWNKFASEGQNLKLKAREGFDQLALTDLAYLDDAAFRALFAKSPIKRIGVARFLRNVAYALGNDGSVRGDAKTHAALEHLSYHEDPIVRDAAEWGMGKCIKV